MSVKLDTKPLENYFDKMADRWGRQQMPEIVKGETIKVLQTCVKKQKAAKVSVLNRSGLLRGYNRLSRQGEDFISINAGNKGGKKDLVWYAYKNADGKRVFKPVGRWGENTALPATFNRSEGSLGANRLGDYQRKWSQASPIAKTEAKRAKASRGSTAKSWYEIMKKITDNPPDVPSYVKNAVRRDGASGIGNATVGFSAKNQFQIKITNASGLAIKSGGQGLVNYAIAARTAFWQRAMRKGWTENAQFMARNAPFIKVR